MLYFLATAAIDTTAGATEDMVLAQTANNCETDISAVLPALAELPTPPQSKYGATAIMSAFLYALFHVTMVLVAEGDMVQVERTRTSLFVPPNTSFHMLNICTDL